MDLFVAARYPPYTPGKLKLFRTFLGSTIPGKSKPGGGQLSSKGQAGLLAKLLGTTGRGRLWRLLIVVLMVLSTRQGTSKL